MIKNDSQKNFSCFFCKSKFSLFIITTEINEILFKTKISNNQNKIFNIFNDILLKNPFINEKKFYICEDCLKISMNLHFFGIENIEKDFKYDFICNSKNANLSFLQLIEIYKCLNRVKFENNIEMFKNIKILFDYMYSNSNIFISQFGNKNFISLIDQLYSLIGLLRDIIYFNSYSNNFDLNCLNNIKDYIEEIFGRINSYKLVNYPDININSVLFCNSHFPMFQFLENNKNIEKNEKNLKELMIKYNQLVNSNITSEK